MQFTFTVPVEVASTPEFYRLYADFLEQARKPPRVKRELSPATRGQDLLPSQASLAVLPQINELLKKILEGTKSVYTPINESPVHKSFLREMRELKPIIALLSRLLEAPEIVSIYEKFLSCLEVALGSPDFDLTNCITSFLLTIAPTLHDSDLLEKISKYYSDYPELFHSLLAKFI